ncbi:unnamed protein product, partial [Cladocopium goreaui]
VLEGSVDQSEQAFLTDEQIKDGFCGLASRGFFELSPYFLTLGLTCTSYPKEDAMGSVGWVRIKTHVEKEINRALKSAEPEPSSHREVLEEHGGSAASTGIRFRQNFGEQAEHLLNQQVQMELSASHAYLAMAAYFDRADVALPGFKEWAQKQSEEEREHAEPWLPHGRLGHTGCPWFDLWKEKFIKYLNLRGGRYVPSNIPEPEDHVFSSALDAMETALKMVRWFQSSRFWRCKA